MSRLIFIAAISLLVSIEAFRDRNDTDVNGNGTNPEVPTEAPIATLTPITTPTPITSRAPTPPTTHAHHMGERKPGKPFDTKRENALDDQTNFQNIQLVLFFL